MKYILWFDEINASDVDLVGGKGANLGELRAADLPVPPGFCLSAHAYRDFLQAAGLETDIQDVLADIDKEDPTEVACASDHIRDLIKSEPMPEIMREELLVGYRKLGEQLGKRDDPRVAVRSSATAEDLPDASFAGQQDTYLNVIGDESLLEKVRDCWASLWTARAFTYREKQSYDHQKVFLAVVVQAMVPAEVSGVLFTANPINRDHGEAVLNASWGLGEAIVSGKVTPDTYVVRKDDGEILSREIGEKEITIQYRSVGGIEEIDTPKAQQEIEALPDARIRALVELGMRIEEHYGTPQDIEWAYADGNLYALQARPITTLATDSTFVDTKDEYNRTMMVEMFPDPLSPAFLSVIRPLLREMLEFTLKTMGFDPPEGREAVGVFYNQPYFNQAYLAEALNPLSPQLRDRMAAQLVNPVGHHERVMLGEISPAFLGLIARLMRFMIRFPPQLPELIERYRQAVEETNALDVGEMTDVELVDHMEDMVFGVASQFLNYDFLMIALINITYQILGTLIERYLGEDTELLQAKLITGISGNVTMESNIRLWDLAQVAKSLPVVSECIRKTSGQELFEMLEGAAGGREFLDALGAFLREYGHREIRMDIVYPTWGEDPTPVIDFVRSYLDADEEQSPHRQQARLVRERRETTEEVISHIEESIMGTLISPLFRWILKQTQIHARERDTMHFELTRLFPPFRRFLNILGTRWTERGDLNSADDIYYLHFTELQDLAQTPSPMHEIVATRRTEFEDSKTRAWPDIISSAGEVFLGAHDATEDAGGYLKGISGSPGMATGVAKVIRGPEEFKRLKKGDILVAPFTTPVWTPLFAIAAGVVTEVGGILSHGAIVAREFGIPAVMSVPGATKLVSEGQRITVDGNRGIVQLAMEGAA
jgi:phosphohistidine swiveling domain-containing protein